MERRNIVISKFEEYYDKQVYFLHKIMTKNKNNNNNNTAIDDDDDDDQGRNQDSNLRGAKIIC